MKHNIYNAIQINISKELQKIDKELIKNTETVFLKWETVNGNLHNRYKQEIKITSIPSNLGKGLIYYFVCPITNNKCRKVYLNLDAGMFMSYSGFKKLGHKLSYPLQHYKGKERLILKAKISRDKHEALLRETILNKYARRFYNNKQTKKYNRCLRYKRKENKYYRQVWEHLEETLIPEIDNLVSSDTIYTTEKEAKQFLKKGFRNIKIVE